MRTISPFFFVIKVLTDTNKILYVFHYTELAK